MEDNEENKKNMETPAESGEKDVEKSKVEEPKNEEEKTFTRDEVNKMINAEKLKERQAVLKELEVKQAEADKLAKMDEEQKKSYELQVANDRATKAESELNAYKLKDETIRQARDRDISLGYLDTINFAIETAESINQKLDIFEKTSKAEREKAIKEYSKESAPQTGDRSSQKSLSELKSYEEIKKYFEEHPDAK